MQIGLNRQFFDQLGLIIIVIQGYVSKHRRNAG